MIANKHQTNIQIRTFQVIEFCLFREFREGVSVYGNVLFIEHEDWLGGVCDLRWKYN